MFLVGVLGLQCPLAMGTSAVGLGKDFIESDMDLAWITDDLGIIDGPSLNPKTF